MRKRLFDENERYTDDGLALSTEADAALRSIVLRWSAEGFSLRDIQAILSLSVVDVCLEEILAVDIRPQLLR